jgi:hypothetical protein
MAKLKCHGQEIGTIYLTTSAKRYMSDGKILRNAGFGWKLYASCKAGFDPAEAFKRAQESLDAYMADKPAMAAYKKELHAMAGLCKRWKLHAAVELMGRDDPDGVWSEACDGYGDNVHADLDDIANLCRLFQAAVTEATEAKAAKAQSAPAIAAQ